MIELVGTHTISAEEYCEWHATGKWAGYNFQVNDPLATFYAYDFKNPRTLARPIKIEKIGRIWTRIDDVVKEQFIFSR